MEQSGEIINANYDNLLTNPLLHEYYGNSDFINWGFWRENTMTQKEACENLLEELLTFIPRKTGNILDVSYGKGSNTCYLSKYYKPEKVAGINISEKQLEICREKSPRSKFLLMEGTKLDFKDASFNNILCVEAAQHFRTRRKFLKEAYRVLKPSGKLVLSDVLASRSIYKDGTIYPKENYIKNINSYRSLLQSVGFCKVDIRDELHSCWKGLLNKIMLFLREKFQERKIKFLALRRLTARLLFLNQHILNYLLVAAEKPK